MTTHYKDSIDKDFAPRKPIKSGVDPIIAQRYSTRAFEREEIAEDDILTLFDAARQAPSCFNEQPWVFYASSNQTFDQFLSFLVPDNVVWANSSSLVFVITAQKNFTKSGKPNAHNFFDCGSAWFALTYQARKMGLYTHAMAGINKEKITDELEIPDTHDVVCAVAVGVIDTKAAEDEEITPRKSLDDILIIK